MIDEKKAQELIAQGEGQHIEFKESVPSKVRELSEEVCAFSNASGGYVFIGVNNKSEFAELARMLSVTERTIPSLQRKKDYATRRRQGRRVDYLIGFRLSKRITFGIMVP